MLCVHIRQGNSDTLRFVVDTYREVTNCFITEEYKPLRQGTVKIDEAKNQLKRQRRREIIAMRVHDDVYNMRRQRYE